MPAEFASRRQDASPFLCASVLLAMRLGENVEVRGPVSAPLLGRVGRIVDLYASWDPRLFRSHVTATDELEPARRADGIACFLSRGVDSLYSATVPRGLPGDLTELVFCDRLEPIHSPGVRAEEVRLATETAALLGLPLVLIESNIRQLTDPIVRDWEDMVGAGLSFLATSMSGGLGHVIIPSSDGPETIGPCGTSPLLDPLFSTAEVEIEHDAPGTRPAKVAWLAREHPEVLPYLKVCYFEDRPDNCGRCSKCLLDDARPRGHGLARPGDRLPCGDRPRGSRCATHARAPGRGGIRRGGARPRCTGRKRRRWPASSRTGSHAPSPGRPTACSPTIHRPSAGAPPGGGWRAGRPDPRRLEPP